MPKINFETDPQNGKPYLNYDMDDFYARLRQNLGLRDIDENQHLTAILAGVDVFIDYIEERPRRLENSIFKVARLLQDAYERGHDDRVRQDIQSAMDENAKRARRKAAVYFIQSGSGPIKIGIAVDVEKRRRSLQTAHPFPLTLLATCGGGKTQESAYHERFAEFRQEGEWFSPHPDILAEIAHLNTSTTKEVGE